MSFVAFEETDPYTLTQTLAVSVFRFVHVIFVTVNTNTLFCLKPPVVYDVSGPRCGCSIDIHT